MSIANLIEQLSAQGVALSANGGKLRVEGPSEELTDVVLSTLKRRKPELLATLLGGQMEPPPRPTEKPGFVSELSLRNGEWVWLQRPLDSAHLAWQAYLEAENEQARPNAEPRGHCGREPDRDENGLTAMERAERWRAEGEVNGYPPGVRPKD